MSGPDIPAAKRAGLGVDLDRLGREGDAWLTPEDRYALKTYGVCAQAQAGAFMVRTRTRNGTLATTAARALAVVAREHARSWLHLTTRQQVELHHVPARDVPAVLAAVEQAGLSTNSACGHTVRGVMACPDAGVSFDEPFDCRPDAHLVTESLLAGARTLNRQLPQRVNVVFGGCPSCRADALVNDIGFVSTLGESGELGYELWLGGSLGKSQPTLAVRAMDFLPRSQVLAAVHAVLDVFVTHGDFEQPTRARLKFLVRKLGRRRFLDLVHAAFEAACAQPWPPPPAIPPPAGAAVSAVVASAPEGGWSSGVRPQRTPGRALVTAVVPLGDLDSDTLLVLADLADAYGDGALHLTKNQNLLFRGVAIEHVPALREGLAVAGLSVQGADQARDVRVCTGGPVCTLAITPAQATAHRLVDHPALVRNSALRLHVSGCPNACAQHQIADLGFSGGVVSIAGTRMLGYQVWLGGDLAAGTLGEVVGRVADEDVPAITECVTGIWEALRDRGESLAATVARVGADAFGAHVDAVFAGRWEPGPEPEPPTVPVPQLEPDLRLPLVRGVPG